MSSEEKFDWCEYYNFADSFSGSDNPAELRSGISRFYYAAFCICRDFLINHKLFLPNNENIIKSKSSKVHEEVVNTFFNQKFIEKKYGKKIGRELSAMREKRNKADYESSNYAFKQDYLYVKKRAKIIFENLEKLK